MLNEAGVNDANNDGLIDGIASTFGNNGLFTNIEDNDMPYANLSYTIFDSDADGTYDPYELDADNDSCNDVIEAGYTDNNSDGILAALPTAVNANGLVTGTSVIDGYTTPDDNNSNGAYDFQEAIIPAITTQPINSVICPGCSTTVAVVATDVSSYQWQVFNGISWVDLTDIGVYGGTSTATLVITNSTPSENGNQYRVVLDNVAYVCASVISSTATLTFQMNTVISNRRITYRVKKN